MRTAVDTSKGTVYKKYSKNMNWDCECGGEFFIDGEGGSEYGVGLGFINGVFGVTKVRYKGFIGSCIKCGKTLVAYKTKKVVHKPMKI